MGSLSQFLNGEQGMKAFKKIKDSVYYYLDNIKATNLSVKIDAFKIGPNNKILVVYRLGRQKLYNTMEILKFDREYFDKISVYDQHRITKFITMQNISNISNVSSIQENSLIKYIQEEINNDQLL